MKLEFKKEKNWQDVYEVYVKIGDGTFRNFEYISKKTGLNIKTLFSRKKRNNIKTFEEFISPVKIIEKKIKIKPKGKINYRSYETKYSKKEDGKKGVLLIDIDGIWKTIREIHEETGDNRDTISARLRSGIDLYNPRKNGEKIDSRKNDDWEGISDEARLAFETGSNKDILALKIIRVS